MIEKNYFESILINLCYLAKKVTENINVDYLFIFTILSQISSKKTQFYPISRLVKILI